jgi:DNA (cytosine-5)-methyltransferase 1
MGAYYNEIDPYAAQWLRNLIAAGHIAPGDVDERSIEDVVASDLRGYTQCHFFAGIGVWSHALRLAGWSDDQPVWTGSCPCQPFSVAGTGAGITDERHLWPVWFNLIRERRPDVIFGEQVEAAIGHGWLDLVQTDLERENYSCGSVGLPAASVGAPHIRQRLWLVAQSTTLGRRGWGDGNTEGYGGALQTKGRSAFSELGNNNNTGLQGYGQSGEQYDAAGRQGTQRHNTATGFWDDCDWLSCRDGKTRAVEPGTFPLAYGVTARVGRLRAYGNAIVPQVAQAIVEAYLES